jgi:hypothetical protein
MIATLVITMGRSRIRPASTRASRMPIPRSRRAHFYRRGEAIQANKPGFDDPTAKRR